MSDARYEQALRRHFRRSLNRGWCRTPYCTTCGALDYRKSLRDELQRAWAAENGFGPGLPEPPFLYPIPVATPALDALAALADRGELVELGVDRDDLGMLHEQLIDNNPVASLSPGSRDAIAHAASRCAVHRPERADAESAWQAAAPEQRLRDLLDDSHPDIKPPWFRPDELGPVLSLSLEDIGHLQALLESPKHRRHMRALRETVDYARSLKDPAESMHAAWHQPERVPPDLATAYRATHFVIHDEAREIVLQIGVRSEEAAALHHRFNVPESCIITAWNPRSQQLSDEENAARHRRLEGRMLWLELPTLPAEGRDPNGKWAPEQSLWIAGAGLREELFLGRALDQYAIVCIGADAVPRLAWPGQARGLVFAERTGRRED